VMPDLSAFDRAATAQLAALDQVLRSFRIPTTDERASQDAVERILRGAGIDHVREYDLGRAHGRIDFYLPAALIGLELKVDGSPAEVMRQLQRYAQSPEIGHLLLLTGRSRLTSVPRALHGKPIRVVSLWSGAF
jgi:hypothetical protein